MEAKIAAEFRNKMHISYCNGHECSDADSLGRIWRLQSSFINAAIQKFNDF